MEPTSCLVDDDAEFRLPPEFLTDDDFLLEKENKLFKGDESNLFPYELSNGYGLDSGLDRTDYLTGFTRKTVRSTQEDDFFGSHANDTKVTRYILFILSLFTIDSTYFLEVFQVVTVNLWFTQVWGATRSTLCGAGIGYQNCQTRVSSQAAAWDMYCAAVEELAMININGYNNRSGRGVLDLPRKHPLAPAAKIPKDGSGYYSRQSLQYQKLQAIQVTNLKSTSFDCYQLWMRLIFCYLCCSFSS